MYDCAVTGAGSGYYRFSVRSPTIVGGVGRRREIVVIIGTRSRKVRVNACAFDLCKIYLFVGML